MLRGTKAKITLLVMSFLVISGLVFVVIKSSASAYSEILTYYVDNTNPGSEYTLNTVIVDGSEDVDLGLRLTTRMSSRLYSVSGSFAQPWNEEQPYYNGYISPSDFQNGTLPSDFQESHDINTGAFSLQCNTIDECYRIEEDSDVYVMTYTISKDTPVGIYHMSIHIDDLKTLDNDGNIDIHEEDTTLDTYIIVKRPSEITFWDGDYNPITEITKRYGDEMFTVTKGVTVGDGSINSYYVESESSEEGVAYIVTGTDYIDIHSTGDARICASTSDTEYYIGTTSCYTVHIEKRPILVLSVIIADKIYDGTTNAEVSEVYFSDRQLDESEYSITNVTLDSPNVGEMRMASFDFSLTELGEKRYTLMEHITSSPAMVKHATLNDLTATITPQTYDPASQSQTVPATVTAMFNGEEITLEEGVDYELYSHAQKVYEQVNFTEAGTYDITISPMMASSIFLFEPFDTTFTINPKVITVEDVQVDDKVYNESNEVHISNIHVVFSEDKLTDRYDYEVSGTLNGVNVGTWDAEVRVDLLNHNYTFYDEGEGTYSDYTVLNVPNVKIMPLELTNENAYYDFNERAFSYTGERIEPVIPLFANVHGSHDSSELSIFQDYIINYSDDTINCGTKYATLVGIGNFTGSFGPLEYFVGSSAISDINVVTPNKVYTGEALEPEPIITATFNGNRIIFRESDYVIDYHESFVDAGSYVYSFTEANEGNYHYPNTEAAFTIQPYDITASDISLSESTYRYDGNSHVPDVIVTVGNTVIDAADYDVEYSADTIGNDESDTVVTVTVRAKENTNISGEATATYTITPREVLTISGIEDNQQITYTGSPVVLEGNVMVEENPGGIKAEDLTVRWYASDGVTIIDRPTNAGSYKVVYSYEDSDYRGALVVNFEITKAESPAPIETETDFKIAAGQTLADLEGERTIGFTWTDGETIITKGNNAYTATYAYNGDAENYETLSLNIPVYGLAHVHVNVLESEGGEVAVSSQEVLEEDTITITVAPEDGHALGSILINGANRTGSVNNNILSIVAGTEDIEIATTFNKLPYDVIEGAGQIVDLDKGDTAKFRIDADYEVFADGGKVYVDGTIVDPENYTSWDGSTYIQLTDEYLNTLSVGEHTLVVAFNDGRTATTTFTILRADDGGSEDDSEGGSDSEGDGDSEDDGDNEGDGEKENEDDTSEDKHMPVPNTGSYTIVSGGATATVGLLAVIIIIGIAIRKIRR